MYNAYETRTTQSCSTSTTGCCSSGTLLTKLVEDTSTSYLCWYPQETNNDMQVQVRFVVFHTSLRGVFDSCCIQHFACMFRLVQPGWMQPSGQAEEALL